MPEKIEEICFGWDRSTDERSLKKFLQKFSREELLDALAPRLADHELTNIIDLLTNIMKKHLREGEYHRLFLQE
ncbi:hypothetical protein ACOHYD_12000 [Desulfobacterota bacterium M19]